MAKTCGSSLRPLVTSEDIEVRCGDPKSVSLIDLVILIPNMTYLHDKNWWAIFKVTGDLWGL